MLFLRAFETSPNEWLGFGTRHRRGIFDCDFRRQPRPEPRVFRFDGEKRLQVGLDFARRVLASRDDSMVECTASP